MLNAIIRALERQSARNERAMAGMMRRLVRGAERGVEARASRGPGRKAALRQQRVAGVLKRRRNDAGQVHQVRCKRLRVSHLAPGVERRLWAGT